VYEGRQGTCELAGVCAFPDPSCPGSGRRYGAYAGDGLAGECVAGTVDAGVDATVDAAGDGGDGGIEAGVDAAGDVARDATGDAVDDGTLPLDGPGDSAVQTDAVPDAPPVNLLDNPGCETDTNGWSGYHADLTRTTTPYGGSYSCQVCILSGYTDFTFDDNDGPGESVVSSPHLGETYVASAWVRASPGVTNPQAVMIGLREWTSAGVPAGVRTRSDPLDLTEAWQAITVTHTVTADRYALDIYVANETAADGDCFLVDDVLVYRQ